jgi:hypothetical protein
MINVMKPFLHTCFLKDTFRITANEVRLSKITGKVVASLTADMKGINAQRQHDRVF